MSTSRIGRMPVAISPSVEVKIANEQLLVKGPKGSLTLALHPFIRVEVEDKEIKIHAYEGKDDHITGANTKLYRSILGTMRARIANMMHGVTNGFEKRLGLVGVGYRAQAKGKVLSLTLGFSHPVEVAIPSGIVIETPTPTEIIIKGIDKDLVGQVAAVIRDYRSPEPYKGKGVRYGNEVIELKETKKK